MRKGCKALLCLAAAVLGMFLVRLAVEKTEPSYPEALGNTLDVEKITGTCLVKEAAELPDTLTIFGSSELKTFEIPTHPANFFAGKRAGFQVNLVGRGSCQSLVHAMAIGASEDSLKGKKIVLITAPAVICRGRHCAGPVSGKLFRTAAADTFGRRGASGEYAAVCRISRAESDCAV